MYLHLTFLGMFCPSYFLLPLNKARQAWQGHLRAKNSAIYHKVFTKHEKILFKDKMSFLNTQLPRMQVNALIYIAKAKVHAFK